MNNYSYNEKVQKMTQKLDVLVVGAGQSGLAMGYYLKQSGLSFAIVDSGARIGDSWRNRYDSLVLFTPRSYPNKDEVADYLEAYARHFALPVRLHTTVLSLEHRGTGFSTRTTYGAFESKLVVVATGSFQKPFIPSMATMLDRRIVQLHSSEYRNASQLSDGPITVVGAGNSGAQIAVELAEDRNVILSAGHPMKFMPLQIGSKSIFWWLDKLGLLNAGKRSLIGKWFSKQPDPIFGYELKKRISRNEVIVKPKVVSAREQELVFADGSRVSPSNVIWATGFRFDYSWIRVPGVLGADGKPIHQRGVSPVSGLFFLGLP